MTHKNNHRATPTRLDTLITAIAILLTVSIQAQWGTISGTIEQEINGSSLPFANVSLSGTRLGTSTNEEGNYKIDKIPFGTYTLRISMVGFETKRKKITLSKTQQKVTTNLALKESSGQLEEIVISGTMKPVFKHDSPVPIEVYQKSFFKANPTPSLFESLQNVNGVRPQLNCNVCNTGDIHINGLEGPYTMILIDGMPIVSGLSTVYGLTGIPQSLIERIEIVKGPASTLYGSEAVGGLINVITKKPANAATFSADVFATSWQEVNTDIGAKFNLGKKAQTLFGLNYFKYDNPIDNNGDNFTDLTLQDRISIFNKTSLTRKNNRLFSIAGRYVYEDRWGGEMQWTPAHRGGTDIYGESIYTSRWEFFGVYQLPLEENIHFQFSGNGHDQNSYYGDTFYEADQKIFFGQFTWFKTLNKHDLVTGATYRYTYFDDNTTATFDNNATKNKANKIHLPGMFVQDQIKFNSSNTLLLGLRYDYNSVHGSILTPRMNYKWTSKNKNTILRLSAGNGYRVANVFTEDHAALSGARDVEFEGTLDPETSWNANINLVKKLYSKGGTFIGIDASAFYTYFNNRIIPDYETDPTKIIYSNLDGHAVSQGISSNFDVVFQNGLKILAGATLMDVRVHENGQSKRQLLTESFQGVWTVSYAFRNIGLSIDYTGNVYGPMHLPLLGDLDDRDPESPWFSIQNIQLTKKLGKSFEIYGGVKNLLNFTPPANSIARPFDPFDKDVDFDPNTGQVIPTPNNPNALTFDPTYVYASNQGIRGFLGLRFVLQ